MKIITHRGWAIGEEENTILAFKKSLDAKVGGVEFDINNSTDGKTIVVSHDMREDGDAPLLEEVLKLFQGANHKVELFIEIKVDSEQFFNNAVQIIEQSGISDQVVLFGFLDVVRETMPKTRGGIRRGIIVKYPWDIRSIIPFYNPEYILMGWDYRKWTHFAFRLYWSIFSLSGVFRIYPDSKFIIGVANDKADILWLSRQGGLYGFMTDNAPLAKELLQIN